jgi:multisubunit Na+/H+ antiporter MnhB subunit
MKRRVVAFVALAFWILLQAPGLALTFVVNVATSNRSQT